MKEPRKILIVRTDRIGDVILSTPVIENLRRAFPESYIAFMCRPYTKEVLEHNPYLNEIIVYDKYGKQKSMFSSILFSFYLKRKKFDWAIILHPTNRVHLLTFFAGIPFRVGWDRKLGFLLTKRIPHTKQEGKKHELQYSLDLLRALGIEDIAENITISPDRHTQNWIDDFLIKNNIDYKKDTLIGLGIGASCSSKIWPPENFAQLARHLKEKQRAKIIVIAQEKEKHLTEAFSKVFKDEFFDLTERLSLKQIFALLRRISLFIGNDSGLIHVAWAVGTPVISIFGRNDAGLSPRRWKPLGKHSYFFHKDVGCTKCLAHNCKIGFLCLTSIKPPEVLDKAVQILAQRRQN